MKTPTPGWHMLDDLLHRVPTPLRREVAVYLDDRGDPILATTLDDDLIPYVETAINQWAGRALDYSNTMHPGEVPWDRNGAQPISAEVCEAFAAENRVAPVVIERDDLLLYIQIDLPLVGARDDES